MWLFFILFGFLKVMYDIIGDIHGHADLLEKLLEKLGYSLSNGVYTHPERKAVFVGDIINRGPGIRKSVRIVRSMVDAGFAYAVLGNHELNAILYATIDKSGKSLRKRLPRYKLPLMGTLESYEKYPEEWKETVKWLRHLPFFLELDGLRVAHGAWIDQYVETITHFLDGEKKLKKHFLKAYLDSDELSEAVNGMVKGLEFQLPKDLCLRDNDGLMVRKYRIEWWNSAADKTFNQVAFGNRFSLPEYSIPKELVPSVKPYVVDEKPVIFGHYGLVNGPYLVAPNLCCIDCGVSRSGILMAYRWCGEHFLTEDHFVKVS